MDTHNPPDRREWRSDGPMTFAHSVSTMDANFEAFMRDVAPYEARSTSAPVFKSPALETLMNCWQDCAPAGNLPETRQLQLSKLAPWMPDITKCSLEGPRDIRYRLAGTRACERLGMDPTGVNLYDLMDTSIRDTIARSFHEACRRPCGFYGLYENVNTAGRRSAIESLYLPLKPLPDGTPIVIGIHAPGEMIDYKQPVPRAAIATTITDFFWIDLGFGAPY